MKQTNVVCLVKYKFHDFVVSEIFDDEVVQLDEDVPEEQLYFDTLKFIDNNYKGFVELNYEHLKQLYDFTDQQFNDLKQFLEKCEHNTKFTLHLPDIDKMQRRAIHLFLRQLKNPLLESNSIDNDKIQITIHSKLQFPKIPNQQRYWNFVLLKKDIDTMQCVNKLVQNMKYQQIRVNQINYCGVKDQRGVTQQIVQIPGYFYPQSIKQAFQHSDCLNNIKIGNFKNSTIGISLGSHSGNQFTITLRCLQQSSILNTNDYLKINKEQYNQLLTNLQVIQNDGIPNLFGLQRFGGGVIPTNQLGQLLMQLKFAEFLQALIINEYSISLNKQRNKNDACIISEEQISTIQKHVNSVIWNNVNTEIKQQFDQILTKILDQAFENKQNNYVNLSVNRIMNFQKLSIDQIQQLSQSQLLQYLKHMAMHQKSFYFHAFQSKIFNDQLQSENYNEYLNNMKDANKESKQLVLVGFDQQFLKNQLSEHGYQTIVQNLLEKYNVDYEQFISFIKSQSDNKNNQHRELFSPGTTRDVYIQVQKLKYLFIEHDDLCKQFYFSQFDVDDYEKLKNQNAQFITQLKELNKEKQEYNDTQKYISLVLRFELQGSAYATEVINSVIGNVTTNDDQKLLVKSMNLKED